jgi:hypothetical protein
MSGGDFPQGITSFGIPVMGGGGIPATFGNVLFVDYRYGSDDNIGSDKDSALKLLSRSNTLARTNANDVILIDGDSEIVETAMVSITKNRTHFIGLNGPPPALGYGAGARITQGTTGVATDIATIHNTGVRNTFTGLKISNSSATATCLYTVAEGGEYTRYNFCEIYKSGVLTTDLTGEVLWLCDSGTMYRCTIGDLVNERGASAKKRPNLLLSRELITGKVCRDGAFLYCLFQQKAAHADVAFVYGPDATDVERRLLFVEPIFWNAVTATADPLHAIDFAAAQTTGDVLVVNPSIINVGGVAGHSLNVYVTGPVPTQNTTGIAVEVSS